MELFSIRIQRTYQLVSTVIKKDDVNIEGILNAILHYHPSVSVR